MFASIAGTPLLYGLYIVWVPCLVYGLLDVSVFVSYGPFTLIGIYMVDVFSQRGYEPCPGLCRDADEGIEVGPRCLEGIQGAGGSDSCPYLHASPAIASRERGGLAYP